MKTLIIFALALIGITATAQQKDTAVLYYSMKKAADSTNGLIAKGWTVKAITSSTLRTENETPSKLKYTTCVLVIYTKKN
jgi:hypothetical protein